MDETTISTPAPAARRVWPLFLLGLFVFLAGPVIYGIQIYSKQLTMPWYMLIFTAVGVVMMFFSVMRKRGFVRIGLLALSVLMGGFLWFFVLVLAKTPDYKGPARQGHSLPAFVGARANGATFTTNDLEDGIPTALIFFRGRW